MFIFSEFEKIQTRKTSLFAHNVQLANCTEKFNVNLLLDPELIFDRTKLCEEGLHDIFNLFPKNFSLKQIKPELSGNNEILTPADYYISKKIMKTQESCCWVCSNLTTHLNYVKWLRYGVFIVKSEHNQGIK